MRNPFSRAPSRPPQSLTAAAQIVTGRQLRTIVGRWAWQTAAWDFYDSCAELHYAINYLAQAASRAKLYVGIPDPNGASEPTRDDDPQAQSLLEELGDDFTAHGELIRKICIHLGVAGESFLIGMDDEVTGERRWVAASNSELRMAGDRVFLRTSAATQVELPDDTTLFLRIYFQNPRYSWEPESHVRALLPDLARLQALSSHILATTDSRLAGAGILFIGDSVSPPVGSPGDEVQHADPFVDGLMASMIAPIDDRNSAAAVVPYVVRVPDESLDKLKHMTFWSEYDDQIPVLVEMTLKKIAIGLNVPPEILLGIGDTNHWSAWALDENVVKISVCPMLAVICQSLTCNYLRPGYEALTREKCDTVIWFDTTELTLRPAKATESLALYKEGLVSGETVRRENGFGEEDAPTDLERAKTLLWELASNPAMAELVLPLLGLPMPDLTNGAGIGAAPSDGADEGQAPAVGVGTSRAIPTRADAPPALPAGGSR